MPITILMPALSPTMERGNLVRWLKNEGERVSGGDVIAEVETDKATMEIECFDDGLLAKILVVAGSKNVAVNTPIALVLLDGEDVSSIDLFPVVKDNIAVGISSNSDAVNLNNADDCSSVKKFHESFHLMHDKIRASPLAKRVAKEHNIDLSKVVGSGPSGRIIKDDVLSFFGDVCKKSGASPKLGLSGSRVEISSMRSTIAERLTYSKQNIPHYYLVADCNVDALVQMRSEINSFSDERVSVNDFIIKAVAMAIKKHPEVNRSWLGEYILQNESIDVSVAVALKDGLITPIIKCADGKNLLQISQEAKQIAQRARSGLLTKEEYTGGSITVSNLGMYDIKQFIAIINPMQSSIIAVGAIEKRVVVVMDEIKIAKVVTVTFSYDHRVIDGALGAEFLKSFKGYVERPLSMFVC